MYNIGSYQKEIKFRLQVAQRRAAKKSKLVRKRQSEIRSEFSNIKVNDFVSVRNDVGYKLDKIYNGPLKVTEWDNMNNVLVSDDNNKSTWIHKNRLKIYNTWNSIH